jgi:two-component system cell cycle sensor histidine kinase/response regulator CckA
MLSVRVIEGSFAARVPAAVDRRAEVPSPHDPQDPSPESRAGTGLAAAVGGVPVLLLRALRRPPRRGALAGPIEGSTRRLLDHLPHPTLVTRAADSKLLYASPRLERLLGVSPARALAEDDAWARRLHPLDRDRVLAAWRTWSSRPAGEPFRSEYRLLAADGRAVWVEDVTTRLPAGHGDEPCHVRQLLDVDARRQLEEQLRQAQRLELVGRLVGAVAHDFNNLLSVISGYSERLVSQPPGRRRDESVLAITCAAQRGASLVRQLLAFSRPQPVERRIVDLNDLVRAFTPMFGHVIGEDVHLELSLEPCALPVEVDPVQVDQVLMNLVVNARDAMPEGGILTIMTTIVAAGTAVVSVSDTGLGMDAATQRRIFDPFFTTKEPGKGSGLGLATASGIVRESGGSIAVFSAPGAGTTFDVYLPLAAGEPGTLLEARGGPAAPAGGREALLLVEDEPALRTLEQLVLEEAGYEVLAAADASEALALAGARTFDVLVVDVVMPGMSGPQLVDELVARGLGAPTVFVSGYGAAEIAHHGLPVRSTVVQKPFDVDVLLRTVREVLDGTSGAHEPHADEMT